MTAIEAKLDAIMHRMDKQERKLHYVHEIGAVERGGMRRSAEVIIEEDSYGVEEAEYMNEPKKLPFQAKSKPTHTLQSSTEEL